MDKVQKLLIKVAKLYLHLWRSTTTGGSTPFESTNPPSRCKCGKCRPEEDPEDRLCCDNHARNDENPILTGLF